MLKKILIFIAYILLMVLALFFIGIEVCWIFGIDLPDWMERLALLGLFGGK